MDAVSDADWVRPPATADELRRDVLLAVALGAGSLLTVWLYGAAGFYEDPAPWWLSVSLLAVSAAVIAFRRRYPLVVALLSAAAFMAVGILRVPELLFVNIELFIAIYTAGAWSNRRLRSVLVRWLIIVVMFGWIFVIFATEGTIANWLQDREDSDALVHPAVAFGLANVITNLLYFGGAYWFGERAWAAARERGRVAALTAELTAAQERTQAQAIALERLRIARELHDVVAHHVSVMGVQAGAARVTMEKDPAAAVAALTAVESSARAAVDELHQLLSTLRDEEPDDGPSLRGIDQLGTLIADATTDRLPIAYAVVGEPRPLTPLVELTLYRVAQEAITNTIKHAGPGASADVRLRYLPDAVELEVTDTGSGGRTTGSGMGQLGMRERVTAVGGTIEFGRRERGGYLVRATVPA